MSFRLLYLFMVHWGNIGSMLAGLSTIVIAVGAPIRGPAVVRF